MLGYALGCQPCLCTGMEMGQLFCLSTWNVSIPQYTEPALHAQFPQEVHEGDQVGNQ